MCVLLARLLWCLVLWILNLCSSYLVCQTTLDMFNLYPCQRDSIISNRVVCLVCSLYGSVYGSNLGMVVVFRNWFNNRVMQL